MKFAPRVWCLKHSLRAAVSMNSTKRGRLFVLAAAVAWSTGGACVKLAAPLSAWQIAGIRSLFACVFISILVKPWRSRPLLPSGKVMLLSLANMGMLLLYICANVRTTAANAIFLQDTAPVWVSLLSPWLLHEPFRARDLRTLFLCLIGMSLFFMDKLSAENMTGNVFALLSGVLYAVILIGMRWGRRKPADEAAGVPQMSDSEAILVWGNLICFVAVLPFMGLSGLGSAGADGLPWRAVAVVAGMGAFQLGLGYYLMSKGIAEIPALEAVLLSLLEPVLSPVWALLLVGERP